MTYKNYTRWADDYLERVENQEIGYTCDRFYKEDVGNPTKESINKLIIYIVLPFIIAIVALGSSPIVFAGFGAVMVLVTLNINKIINKI